jgi:hypothetical protein
VQQRRGDVAAHPLPEAELADRGVEQVAEVEQLDVLREVAAVPLRVDPVERCPNTTPIRRARSVRCRLGSRPATRSRPAVGTRMPVSILIVVDFPAPLGPM